MSSWDFSNPNVKFNDPTYLFDGTQAYVGSRISNGARKYFMLPMMAAVAPLIAVPTPTLSAAVVSSSEIDLTATYAAPPPLATYTFQISTDNATWTTLSVQASSTYAANTLASATLYYFRVSIQTTEYPSRSSAYSATVTGTTQTAPTVPGQVTGLTATPATTTVVLNWTAVPTTTSYVVYRAGTLIGGATTTTYTDSGLTPSTAYQYTVAAHNAVGYGATSTAVNVTTQTVVIPVTAAGAVPWYPTLYAMSVANPPSGVLSNYENEINAYAASLAANPGLQAIVGGYSPYIGWNILESTSTKGVYDFTVIGQTYSYLQSKVPGARFLPQTTCYQNWLSTFSASAGQSILPPYVYNGGPATYGACSTGGKNASGGPGSGWGLIAYQSGNAHYGQVIAGLWNTNVSQCYANMIIALMQYLQANCPNADGVLDYTPSEFANFQSNPTTPTSYNSANWVNNWNARAGAIRAAAPGLIFGTMMEYTSTGMVDADLQNMVNTTANAGAAFSCTDVFWSGTAIDPTEGQNLFTGTTSGSIRQIGNTSSFPTVQPEDYERTGAGASSTPNTAAQIQNILTANCYGNLHADHVCVAMASETAATTPVAVPAFSLKAWYDTTKTGTAGNGYLVTGILAAGGIPTSYHLYPLNLMYPVAGVTTTVNSSTQVTLNWTLQPGITSYNVLRNGTVVGSSTSSSYTDHGLTTGTTYTYTVQMVNSYGTGPSSAPVTARTI